MKRKKTRPPQPEAGEIEAVADSLRRLPRPSGPFNFVARARLAEQAREIYNRAWQDQRNFPWNTEASANYSAAQERYREAILAAYPHDFAETLQRLKSGDTSDLEDVLAFLEADPFFYATGYLKEDLCRWFSRVELPPPYIVRLRRVVLALVDKRHTREFSEYGRLACKVDSPELREELAHRLASDDPAVRRRARWMLEALQAQGGNNAQAA